MPEVFSFASGDRASGAGPWETRESFFLAASRLAFAASPLNSVAPNAKKTSGTQGTVNPEWIRIRVDGRIRYEYAVITYRVDADIFVSGKKKLRIKKYPDTCGRDGAWVSVY